MRALTVPASIEGMYQALAQIGIYLEQEGCPEAARRQIEISAEELLTNIASYAYEEEEREKGQMQMACEVLQTGGQGERDGQKKVRIEIRDWGRPFDPFAKADPDIRLPFDERPVGGLGIYMVKQFMDGALYRYEDGQNITVIEKGI